MDCSEYSLPRGFTQSRLARSYAGHQDYQYRQINPLAWNLDLDMDQLLLRLNGGLRRRVLLEPRIHLEVPFPDGKDRGINHQLH